MNKKISEILELHLDKVRREVYGVSPTLLRCLPVESDGLFWSTETDCSPSLYFLICSKKVGNQRHKIGNQGSGRGFH